MRSERLQRQVERFLDQCEAALDEHQWAAARDAALAVLGMDAENADAQAYIAAAESAMGGAAQPAPTRGTETALSPGDAKTALSPRTTAETGPTAGGPNES